MSATNSTPTINLPLFIGTDKPAWLTDWNGSMNAIDSAIATLQTAEGGTATALASLSQSVTALSGTVEQHTTAIQTVTTATATNTGSINTITSLIGNGEPTTDDKTIIGAINKIYADIGGGTGVDAEDVTYDNQTSGLTATNVQAAIDEVYAAIPSSGNVEADDVSYDNTSSGLTATNVQAAIDELASNSSEHSAFGTAVNLASYTSFANAYTAPSDGYLNVYGGDSGSSFVGASIYGSNATSANDAHTSCTIAAAASGSVFVRKGTKLMAITGNTSSVIRFSPLQ